MPRTRDTVKVQCFVQRDVHERFKRLYPHYGMLAWALESTMRELLRQTEGDPTAQERIAQAVRSTIRAHHYNPNPQLRTG